LNETIPALVLPCRDPLEVTEEQQVGEHMWKLPTTRLGLPPEPGGKAPRIRYHVTLSVHDQALEFSDHCEVRNASSCHRRVSK
jgi:hypothetical protein